MDCRILLILLSVWICSSRALRFNLCPTNKIAPYPNTKAEGRSKTLGLLFGDSKPGEYIQQFQDQFNFPEIGPLCDPPPTASPNDNPSLADVDGVNQQTGDYDPVNSEEDVETYNNRPGRPQRPSGGNGNFWNWVNQFPGVFSADSWPTRPPRPNRPNRPHRPHRPHRPYRPQRPNTYNDYSDWFWSWFGGEKPQQSNRPPKPTRPPYYGPPKPVHENIDDDTNQVVWKPGAVVGGPSNNIIPVSQDFSNWSTSPRPRPTRPYIPGQRDRPYPKPDKESSNRNDRQGIIGSFVDLFTKR